MENTKTKAREPRHICLATDGTESQPALVMTLLDSLRRAAFELSDYRIHMLCDNGESSLGKDFLSFLYAFSARSGIPIEYHACKDIALEKMPFLSTPSKLLRFPVPAWYRFVAADVVEEDRFLYLDTDTLFIRDPKPLFAFDLKNAMVGTVPDVLMEFNDVTRQWCLDRKFYSPIPEDQTYVASSVLLIDRKRFLESDIVERITDFAGKVSDMERHDNNLLSLALKPEEVAFMPLAYHSPIYPFMSVGSQWEHFLPEVLGRLGYQNKYAFFADSVTVQLQGDKKSRYFDDPVLGPVMHERVAAVRHYCFPEWY